MEADHLVVLVTVGSEETARHLAKVLIEKKLAACANLLPVRSLYMWEGKLQDDAEVLMIIKSTSQAFKDKMVEVIQANHPYDLPEIIGLPVVVGSQAYLQWVTEATSGE